ncbi:MAG: hypothetical protein ACRDVE_16120 [Actinocrinis sp.]
MELRELRDQQIELLPGREALNYFKLTFAKVYARNTALALNLLSGGSSATALAGQTIVIG